jgi:mono/diheme cytochrome c family protein
MKLTLVCLAICAFILTTVFVSCQSEAEIEYKRYYVLGRNLYQTNCTNCHAENGEGLGTLIPSLKDATYLKNNKNKLACMIQYGLQGGLVVNGKIYNGKMPAQKQLAPIEVAEVITYITNTFGNQQGLYNVEKVNADLQICQ